MQETRILICGFSAGQGGMESYVMDIYRHCNRERLQMDFLIFFNEKFAYAEEIKKLGGRVFFVPKKRKNIIQYYLKLNRIFKLYNYNAIYYQATRKIRNLDVFKIAKKHKVPIRALHSHSSMESEVPWYIKLRENVVSKNMSKYVNSFFACSTAAGKWMFGDKMFKVINNGVDTCKFNFNRVLREQVREKLGVENKIVIGTIGRLVEEKNPKFLLDVVKDLHAKREDVCCIHVGGGKLENELREYIEKNDMQAYYYLLGKRSDTSELLNAMDVFVLPSTYEGFPFVLVEAQATGLPCIVSEAIPQECSLIGKMEFVSLKDDLDVWERHIIKSSEYTRADETDMIKNKGYDIYRITETIENFFCKQ